MFANLRTGLGWLRSAVAWRMIEGVLVGYQQLERILRKWRRPSHSVVRR